MKQVQRIPRYNLLLSEFIKTTWPDHIDYDTLKKSLEKIKQVATYMNQRKKEAETESKIIEIQNRIAGDVVSDWVESFWVLKNSLLKTGFGCCQQNLYKRKYL